MKHGLRAEFGFLLALLALPLLIDLAQAQDQMHSEQSASLKVIGLYTLSADNEVYSRFIRAQIALHDPANFSDEQRAQFHRLGRGDALHPFTDEDRKGWEEQLRRHMDDAAVLEVLVSNPDANFEVGAFAQPDPSRPENSWQVAWNEKFLTFDGEKLLDVSQRQTKPDAKQYRVVFVIHHWKRGLPLKSSYGELALPSMQPLPERLWRLTPYELPD